MRLILLIIIALALCSPVFGQVISDENITLLALSESGGNKSGTIATLSLKIVPGKERVFLETYPLTKISTQASLRFAQQVACKELDFDCSDYDFLFSIDALPGIIGGPSAGSPAALLVAASLLNKSVPDNISMTGTINSGGMIGPVGGIKYKVEAAGKNHLTTVLLPKGTARISENNTTTDLVALGNSLNLTVLEVATIGDALELVLNHKKKQPSQDLRIDPRYETVMKSVAEDLCGRTEAYEKSGLNASLVTNMTDRAANAFANESYYSAASYCFQANVEYYQESLRQQNLSEEDVAKIILTLKKDADRFLNETLRRDVSTITDVQTLMAVHERVDETYELLRESAKNIHNESVVDIVGLAQERLYSAKTWSRFFNGEDKIVVIDQANLKEACASKIAEAEERFSYVISVIPEALENTREDIQNSYRHLKKKNYIMCLYTASKAKAQANVLLSLLGVEERKFDEVIELKLEIAKKELIAAQQKGIFPIIAYSYYDYANSLKEFDRVSALLFTEYSLEMSYLDVYFEKKKPKPIDAGNLFPAHVISFFAGLAIGGIVLAVGLQYGPKIKRKKKRSPKKHKSSSKKKRRKRRAKAKR